jgi:hypothetical protein
VADVLKVIAVFTGALDVPVGVDGVVGAAFTADKDWLTELE